MIYVNEPAVRNYIVIRGQSFYDAFTIKQNNAAVDLTGWSARERGKRNANDASFDIDLSSDNGGIVLGGSAGTVVRQASPATTRQWPLGDIPYQLEFEHSGAVQTYLVGVYTVLPEVA